MSTPKLKNVVFLTLLWFLPILILVCKAPETPIVVSSKNDTEGALLGKMMVLLLEDHGYSVRDRVQLGPTPLIRKALISGEIDIYPEYTGNGALFFQSDTSGVWKDAGSGYEAVKKLDLEKNLIVWLQPAPANNTWAIAVRGDFAAGNNIHSMPDFARYINHGGEVKLAASEEFVSSPAALPAFQAAYEFKLQQNQLLVLAGGNTAATLKALAEGINNVNAAMAYGTDGALSALNLQILEDTKKVQPVYAPAPIIRKSVLEKYPEIETILAPLFESLDLKTLQTLNAKIAALGIDTNKVAKDYLKSLNLLSQ